MEGQCTVCCPLQAAGCTEVLLSTGLVWSWIINTNMGFILSVLNYLLVNKSVQEEWPEQILKV